MTHGSVGNLPDWYEVVEACHYVSVAPWEMAARPDCEYWVRWILTSRNATQRALNTLNRQG